MCSGSTSGHGGFSGQYLINDEVLNTVTHASVRSWVDLQWTYSEATFTASARSVELTLRSSDSTGVSFSWLQLLPQYSLPLPCPDVTCTHLDAHPDSLRTLISRWKRLVVLSAVSQWLHLFRRCTNGLRGCADRVAHHAAVHPADTPS